MKNVYKKFTYVYCEYLEKLHCNRDLKKGINYRNVKRKEFKSLQDYCHRLDFKTKMHNEREYL